jgi:5,10-methylene-tetrahydrofolate dehydrogenase/methenyl tetrahydrofolate cyclohydrolase
MEMLERCGIVVKGKRAVVVGRSNIVGMPAALLLNKRDATVTIAHSGTKVRPVSQHHRPLKAHRMSHVPFGLLS